MMMHDDNDYGTGLCSEFVIFIWFYEIQYSLFMVINTNQVIYLYMSQVIPRWYRSHRFSSCLC